MPVCYHCPDKAGVTKLVAERMFPMDEERKKGKKRVIVVFIAYLCIALACFGFCAYTVITYRGTELANSRIVDISKIAALIGVFFLVVAFGYLLPALITEKKRGHNSGEVDPSAIFEETNMRRSFEKYMPDGETLLAGIHAVSKETNIEGIFGRCVRTENGLVPNENGGIVKLSKKKYAGYDIYLGITQYSLLITECEKNSYYYEFYDDPKDVSGADIKEVTSDIAFVDIGTCFSLADIQSCEIKDGSMGSVKCFITMKNGSYFKLMLPKLGGLGGGMPHHTEYREAIIARLSGV